jgi:DNA-binding NarL/FixJ family response regulator
MTSHTVRVIIADDHPVLLDGLTALLATQPSIHVVGVSRSFNDVLEMLSHISADVLILGLGGMGGAPLTIIHRIQRLYPALAIVVFSSSVVLAPELLQAGVRGYIAKEDLTDQLLAAIAAVHAGQTYRSPKVEEYLQTTKVSDRQHLSPKELNVLKLLSHGLGTVAIAEQMGIDPRSVQNYVTILRRKTGCVERTQLADWYRRLFGDSTEFPMPSRTIMHHIL